MIYKNNTNLRLHFYYYMRDILNSDSNSYSMSEFKNNIHTFLHFDFKHDDSEKKKDFCIGDKVILSDVAIANYFPRSLAFIPIIGKISDRVCTLLGTSSFEVEDLVTGIRVILGSSFIEKRDLNKEYILKLLVMTNISRRASRGIKIDFLSDQDIKNLAVGYQKTNKFFPNEIKLLESLADNYLNVNDKISINNRHINELKDYFRKKLVSYFYRDELEENVNLALRTYYQFYDNTVENYSHMENYLIAHYVVQSFEYDFLSKSKALTSKERLFFTKVMNMAYSFLAYDEKLSFERLRHNILLAFENSGNFENFEDYHVIFDNAILMSIHNFRKDEKKILQLK